MALRDAFRGSVLLRLIGIGLVLGLAQLPLAGILGQGDSVGHARFHALFALGALVVGGGIVARWPSAGWASRAPALGLLLLAIAQLVESVGVYGYNADETRNVIARLHDLGVDLSLPGLLAAGLGLPVGVAVAASRLHGARRWVGMAGTAVVGVGGLLVVKTMIGM